jgi:hypothetical protein
VMAPSPREARRLAVAACGGQGEVTRVTMRPDREYAGSRILDAGRDD